MNGPVRASSEVESLQRRIERSKQGLDLGGIERQIGRLLERKSHSQRDR